MRNSEVPGKRSLSLPIGVAFLMTNPTNDDHYELLRITKDTPANRTVMYLALFFVKGLLSSLMSEEIDKSWSYNKERYPKLQPLLLDTGL